MASDNDCPRCERNIGVWAVLKATLPNRIFCPHCRTRLEYGGTWGLLIAAIVVTIVLIALAAWAYVMVSRDRDFFAGIIAAVGVLMIGGLLLEVGLVMQLWYGGYRLQEVGKPRQPEGQEQDW